MLEMLYSNPGTPQSGMSFDFTPRPSMGSRQSSSYSNYSMTREEHRLKELSLLREGTRSPRRSHTLQNYQTPAPSAYPVPPPRQEYLQQVHVQPPTPPAPSTPSLNQGDNGTEQPQRLQPEVAGTSQQKQDRRVRRPALGPPRRSYSVMDHEPLPHHHRPAPRGSNGLSLMDLPKELHYTIFDFLDPIDSTCLGLTNKQLYSIHRRMHGTVPLSARRDGPNELEWAWHLHIAAKGGGTAGNHAAAVATGKQQQQPAIFETADGSGQAKTPEERENERQTLAKLRVKGQAYCRKCGVCRCELHKHIQDWMGEGMEYCQVKQKFGPVALEGAKPFCYMSTPRHPTRCGRHKVRKDKVTLK